MREKNLSRNNINYNEETGYIPVSFLKMKNWIIIVITLLLTALYVMSVRQALGGLRYLHRHVPDDESGITVNN